ncbi:MAG: TIGR02281 family clan AA aspartic protease [Aestuariibacter sp.]
MKLLATVLFISLVSSIALNVYLFGRLHISEVEFIQSETTAEQQALLQKPVVPAIESDDPIDIAFNNREISAVLSQFAALHQSDPDNALIKKNAWFDTLYGRINARQHRTDDIQFIQRYLKQYPYDKAFLFLEIIANAHRDEPAEQLASLYELANDNDNPELAALLQTQINERLRYSVERLIQISAWDILAAMLESLVSYDPENRYILIRLATAYAETRQFSLMESTLAYLPYDDKEALRLKEKMRQQLAQPEPDRQITAGIPLQKSGDHFTVATLLNNLSPAQLMIDTGASTSVISQTVFDNLPASLNPRFIGKYPVNTAGGRVMAPIYRFRALSIEQFSVPNIALVVLPIEGLQADGLLGMNFLREFHFQLDQENSELFLSHRIAN